MNRPAIIFDFGGTLYDHDQHQLFPDALPTVEALAPHFTLALVSIVVAGRLQARQQYWDQCGLAHWFTSVIFLEGGGLEKDQAYEETLQTLHLRPSQVSLVDDRVVRGIAWGNRRGAANTIWIRQGKFKFETPNPQTGNPTFIINNLAELLDIFSVNHLISTR